MLAAGLSTPQVALPGPQRGALTHRLPSRGEAAATRSPSPAPAPSSLPRPWPPHLPQAPIAMTLRLQLDGLLFGEEAPYHWSKVRVSE